MIFVDVGQKKLADSGKVVGSDQMILFDDDFEILEVFTGSQQSLQSGSFLKHWAAFNRSLLMELL